MKRTAIQSLAIALFAVVAFTGCSSTQQLASVSPEGRIFIDGDADEWYDVLTKVDNDRLQVAVSNDDQFLHMVVRTSNRTLAQMIIGNGLDVQFESDQEGFEPWGMRYPVSVRQVIASGAGRPGGNGDGGGEDAQSSILEETSKTINIMYGPEQPVEMKIGTMGRFEAAATYQWEVFTAEWRIPLSARNNSEVALATMPLSDLSIRLTTPEATGPGAEAGERPEAAAQGGRGGGRGGARGGAQGGGRGGQAGAGGQSRVPLDVTLEVTLGDQ